MLKYLLLAIVTGPLAVLAGSFTAAIGQIYLEGRANATMGVSWMSDGGQLLAIPFFYLAAGITLVFLIPYLIGIYRVIWSSLVAIHQATLATPK